MKFILLALFSMPILVCKAQDTTKPRRDTQAIFTKVEIEADYPGSQPAWLRFLNKNLRYPNDAVDNNIQGDIVVQFQVDTAGNVSEVHAISGPTAGGLREEAEHLIKMSGKWTPAIENGHLVQAWVKRVISFKLVRR